MSKNKPKLSLICALSKDKRAMGCQDNLLWRIPADMKRLHKLTKNHAIIMGRKTYDSIGYPLPDRLNIILTKNKNWQAKGCVAAYSLEEALKIAEKNGKKEIFIFGGGDIFKQTIDSADKLYLTVVEDEPKADTFFPEYSKFNKIIYKKDCKFNNLKYCFLDLTKNK